MSEAAILQLISTTGAAAALFWVVYQFVQGKLHNQAEIDAYIKRIDDLNRINTKYGDQFDAVNGILEKAIQRGYNERGRTAR